MIASMIRRFHGSNHIINGGGATLKLERALPPLRQLSRKASAVDTINTHRSGLLAGIKARNMGQIHATEGADHHQLAVTTYGKNIAGHLISPCMG